MNNIPELFGTMVFNDDVMRRRLPKEVYRDLTKTIATGRTIDPAIADVVANAMKDWPSRRVPPTIPTGSSRSRASPPRSTTPSSLPSRATAW